MKKRRPLIDQLSTWWCDEPIVAGGVVMTRAQYAGQLVRNGLSPLHAASVAAAPYTGWRPCTFLLGFRRRYKTAAGIRRQKVLHVDRLPGAKAAFSFQIDYLK